MTGLFGLTTVAALKAAQSDCERYRVNLVSKHEENNQLKIDCDKWKADFYANNETIERLQQLNNGLAAENKALAKNLETTTAKVESLTQELNECKIWAKTLEDTNKEQADKLGKQVEAINKALDEAAQQSLLYNQVTVENTQLKLAVNRYKIAIDNLNLELNNHD